MTTSDGRPHVFDADTGLEPLADGHFAAVVPDRWNIADVPNGGFLSSLLTVAMSSRVPHPDPLTVTAHYLGPTAAGQAVVEVDVIKSGRSLSTATARLLQEGRERVRAIGTFGDLDSFRGPTELAAGPPDLGPESELVPGVAETPLVRLQEQFDYEIPGRMAAGARGEPTGTAEITGRIRFSDGRPPDLVSLPLIVDAFPPAVFQIGHYGWTPTLELTLHCRARPRSGWLTCRVRTRFLQDGMLEEDVEVWDVAGRLVGLSRQLALAAV